MAVYTLYPTDDGYVGNGTTSNWSAARSATPGATASSSSILIQAGGGFGPGGTRFSDNQGLLTFDTSGVVGTISSVTLSLYHSARTNSESLAYTVRLYPCTYTTPVSTGDKLTSSAITGSLLSSITDSTFGSGGTGIYYTFASSANFIAAINQSGNTQFVVTTDSFVVGSPAPAGTGSAQSLTFHSVSTSGGTTTDPYLTVTTVDAAGDLIYPKVRWF